MRNSNLLGLYLATLISKDFQEIDEELRRTQEEASQEMTRAIQPLQKTVTPSGAFTPMI
ncbi:MAG: hypothetical protein WCJ35_11870 [Planctomycetota bacterium]